MLVRTLFSEIWEGLLIALRAIGVHKLRAVLTTLGIIIGIASVTSMATVINGLERGFDDSMSELGTDVLYIEKWPWVSGPGFKWWNYINRPEITADLAEVIQERARYAVSAVPVVETNRNVAYGSTTLSSVRIEASTPDYPQVHAVELTAGRFYTEIENRGARPVCVIGAQIADELFPLEDPLGKYVRVAGHRFQVIGVLERKGTSADGPGSQDSRLKIPYNTFKSLFGVSRRSVSVQVKVAAAGVVEEAKDELIGIVRAARRLDALDADDFEINEQQSLRAQLAPVKLTIYLIGIFLTALSLLVGGIGVMNIMFVSVKERTREIGLRKAVGARRRTILTQFLIEAIIICVLGGAIGVLLSLVLTVVINVFITALLPLSTVMIAFGICMAIGIIFGLAPAWAAAKAEPIEALRYE